MPMRQVEIAAKSVEDAVRLALEQLDRKRDEVDVEVLSGGASGDEDDEVLVRVTARERLTGRAARPPARVEEPVHAAPAPPTPERWSRPAAPPPPVAPAAPPPALVELEADDFGEGLTLEDGEQAFAS